MEKTEKYRLGEVLYGLLFTVVLPALLFLWARATEAVVSLPAVRAPVPGWAAVAAGAALMALGMRALVVHGGGLPMNAYPPPRHVAVGIYRYLSHPIYIGFVLACVGLSLVYASASGLWLVSPAAAAGAAALILGYERRDLELRFGKAIPKPLLGLPPDDDRALDFWARLSVYLLALAPWLLVRSAADILAGAIGVHPGRPPFPFLTAPRQYGEWIYASGLPGMLLAPLAAGSNRRLRRFARSALWAAVIAVLLLVLAPLAAPAGASFRAFAVVESLLTAAALAGRLPPALSPLFWAWAAAVCVSCIATGRHNLIDVATALLAFLAANKIDRIWAILRRLTERIANSWKEWRLGAVRVMSHGFFAGLAGFVGLLLMGALVGEAHLGDLFAVCVISLLGAGLWAQFIEGSSALLRPFGYYGSVIGALVGGALVQLTGGQAWTVLAAVSMAAPWMQAIGRVRCLIQGCCHGRECGPETGIRYLHPRSRVVRLSNLGGVPVHPTPLYSILWNLASGLVLLRLWLFAPVPFPFICGAYLMLNGLGRFVEESFRGEPQTPRKAGLPIYQWNAVASLATGAFVTCIHTGSRLVQPSFDWKLPAAALAFGLIAAAAMGVDFPGSNRRFSRLV